MSVAQIPSYRFTVIYKDENVTVRRNDALIKMIKASQKSS